MKGGKPGVSETCAGKEIGLRKAYEHFSCHRMCIWVVRRLLGYNNNHCAPSLKRTVG